MSTLNRKRRKLWYLVIVNGILLASILVLSWKSTNAIQPAAPSPALTRPVRLIADHPQSLEELLLGLRVHHYRAQFLGQAQFVDYFFDTEDWDLARQGYSYRYRIRLSSDSVDRYGVRLEREPRFSVKGQKTIESRDNLNDSVGAEIEAGNWMMALTGGHEIETILRLQEILLDLDLEVEQLAPRLRGELRRSRYDITDKGQSWFELDLEEWTFSTLNAEQPVQDLRLLNFALDTRLNRDDPELHRRVLTMQMMSDMMHASRATELAPHEQALRVLTAFDERTAESAEDS